MTSSPGPGGGAAPDQVPPSSRFGLLLRQYRLARGLTQEELAGASGLTARTVANLERSRTRPYRRSVRVLADALGLTPPERAELDRASRLTPAAGRAPAPPEAPGATRANCQAAARSGRAARPGRAGRPRCRVGRPG